MKQHWDEIRALLRPDQSLSDEGKSAYGRDYTEDLYFEPGLVVFPESAEEVSQILAYCNHHFVPVSTRGAGTGLSGGALPNHHGLVLAMERMNKILNIDTANLQATVQPGVINETFQQAVAEFGLYYPPDPASMGSCFLGGNIAHGSGGPKAVKYGTTRDYVLSLEVVRADGHIFQTGASVLKNSTGYNLTQLMVGSEGTLGVVTSITFRLIPKPKHQFLFLAAFESDLACTETVSVLFQKGFTPSCCEFMTPESVDISAAYLGISFPWPKAGAYLLMETDGMENNHTQEEGMKMAEVCLNCGAKDVLIFDTAEKMQQAWKIRRTIGEAAKKGNIYKEEDTVVPRAELPLVVKKVRELEKSYGFRAIIYGHAGDGNLHINILKDEMNDEKWNQRIPDAIRSLFETVVSLGGTISGEHGIGLVQKEYLPIAIGAKEIQMMKGIKMVFDPHNILNPGKIW